MENKVAIICVYLGVMPSYFSFTRKSILHNKDYDWFIFTDQYTEVVKDNNITFIPISMGEINNRLSNLLGEPCTLPSPYKLCDSKPLYADLFADYIREYNWFGWTDLDIIYGDFCRYINDDLLNQNDIISSYSGKTIFGPLSFLKKSSCHNLYKDVPDIINLVTTDNPNHSRGIYNVDETILVEIIKKRGLKIYSGEQINGHNVPIFRHGKRKLPATWNNGTLTLDTYKEDYWESYADTYGSDTLALHLSNIPCFRLTENGFRILPTQKLKTPDVSALVCTYSGLNDMFSSLAHHIELFKLNKWSLSNLYVYHEIYDDLSKYFDFKEIQIFNPLEQKDFSFISTFGHGGFTFVGSKDLFNYVSIKKEIIESAPKYPDHIAFHFRCMYEEMFKPMELVQEEKNIYLKAFRDRYHPDEKYLIVSDSNYFKFMEAEYLNVTCLLPEVGLSSSISNRRTETLFAVKQLCSLGSCKKIYKTKGSFTNLAAFIQQDIPIERICADVR